AAEALAARVPAPLAPLARIAFTYRWSWLDVAGDLFATVDPLRWERCGHNPVRLLEEARMTALKAAAVDPGLVAAAERIEAAMVAELARPRAPGRATAEHPAAFLCAEFAVHRSLPVYAGGLGVLAGDLLKTASDLSVPLVAVGLLYRQGYFRQRIDPSGWQHEYWIETDPERLPAALVTTADGRALTVTVPIRGRHVVLQIWRVDVGGVALYLLDAERGENTPVDRWITGQLYVADPAIRLAQYVMLGIGGVRALHAMGIEPAVVHVNEGHGALAPLEMARQAVEAGAAPADALDQARDRTVFTTHTPVAAGNETYDADTFLTAVGDVTAPLGLSPGQLVDLGRTGPGDDRVGFTQLGLRLSRAANGVSRRHGEVARAMWQYLYPGRPVEDVPIRHVTNGVHAGTWMAGPVRRLVEARLGPRWDTVTDEAAWAAAVDDIADEELWAVRTELRRRLVDFVRERSVSDRLTRGEPLDYVEDAAEAFDPGCLTIGFARRLATYKRLHLLVQDPARALQLLSGSRPLQLVMAGKAHPRDDDAKRLVQTLFRLKDVEVAGARAVYLHDYDMGLAAELVAGCDVWINLPRPPMEASGTSGMKSAMNGGLQLSVLDGWWCEAYDGTNGWAVPGDVDADQGAEDATDAGIVYSLLEQEVVPAFYDRDERGLPVAWLARVRRSLATIGPRFSAARMLGDYLAGPYRGFGA
ncbi:MAG TPA: alpha-glucan family phosphorylase, partial [Acidimicrobiales bacterium]|nr:alpha-glucan family phosphorylase [Acidimicrobiales bacterium]